MRFVNAFNYNSLAYKPKVSFYLFYSFFNCTFGCSFNPVIVTILDGQDDYSNPQLCSKALLLKTSTVYSYYTSTSKKCTHIANVQSDFRKQS